MRDFILKTFTDDEAETCLRCNMQEVVHCKDCNYRHDSINCRMCSEGMNTDDDWFCADGVKK